ncbi:MAG TPA: efflux RND transporter periplasmic adaptor subunit [Vicinamibacterales bacterium]|jgi:multidrug efflux system membrane fusion protein|nr:efflux RND transporter periplasmic adaptor subunit [Vicinamibacterales bacterium]
MGSAQFRSLQLLSLLSLASVLIAGCNRDTAVAASPSGRGGGAGGAVPVLIAKVVEKPMPLEIGVIGSVEAYSTVAVRSQITGLLTSVNFKEGEDVQQGQVLFVLDRRPLEGTLAQAQANLTKDLAQAANARQQLQRFEDLAKSGLTTRDQLDTATSAAASLDAVVGADRAAVDNAKVQLDYATISAPIAGRTGSLIVHVGNLVRATDVTALVNINQVAPIYVSFGVPEARLPELKRHMAEGPIRVAARAPTDSDPPSLGTIDFVDNAVDQTTGTIKVKAAFPNADRRLWPGQFVNVVVTLSVDQNAIVVPSTAVQTGDRGPYVFVIKPDKTADQRMVTVARINGAETIIGDGLKSGETVVTDGALRLVTGSRITIKTDDAGPKAES